MSRRREIDDAGAFHTERPSAENAHGFEIGDDAAGRWLKANDRKLRASNAARARHAKTRHAVNATGGAA